MKNLGIWGVVGAIVICIVLIVACSGPKVKNLYQDESFNGASVRSGKLYVGGVAYAVGEIEEQQEIEAVLTDQLMTEMSENIKDCHIPPNNLLANRMEEPAYQAVVNAYGEAGELDKDIQLWLEESFGDEHACIAFGRVEKDDTWNAEEKVKDSTGEVIATKFCAYRRLKIRMEVYDITLKKMVWSGHFSHKECTANRYDEIFGSSSIIDIIADAIIDEEGDREFPSPPGWLWVADDIFKSFAKSLPEK
jgi:hypothetical protein